MPALSVGNDIVFHYTDSGPIKNIEYSTLVLVHGFLFHTGMDCHCNIYHGLILTQLPGVFKRILPLATSHSMRVICLSRRKYEGSTPYSTDELNVIHHGSEAELADFKVHASSRSSCGSFRRQTHPNAFAARERRSNCRRLVDRKRLHDRHACLDRQSA